MIVLLRAFLTVVALVAAIFLAGVIWGRGSIALVYLPPPILAIWFSDRTSRLGWVLGDQRAIAL